MRNSATLATFDFGATIDYGTGAEKERLTQILGGSLLLFRSILGQKWADFGLFWVCRSPSQALRLCVGCFGGCSQGFIFALCAAFGRSGCRSTPAIKAPQNGTKRAQEEQRKSRSRYCVPSAANNKAVNGQTVNGSILFCFLA